MEFEAVVRARRMVRAYQPDRPVPTDVLSRLLDLAIRAPSAGFSQGWNFLVLTAEPDRRLFWDSADADPEPDPWLEAMSQAPALVLCLSDPEHYLDRYAEPDKGWSDRDRGHWPIPYWDVDTGMAALLILLGAVDAGLAGCFFGVPQGRHEAVAAAFDVPANRRIVGVISLGYPAPDRRSPSLRRGRRPVSEVAYRGRFGSPWPD